MKPEKISLPVAQMIRRAAQQADDFMVQAAPVPPRQAAVLLAVAAVTEGVMPNQIEIVKQTGIDRSTLASILDRMERDKLVTRKKDPRDARGRLVFLTRAGRAQVEAASAALAGAGDELLNKVGKADRAAFIRALEAIAGAGRE